MARIFADRVKQISTTTGTGPFTLSSTPAGFRAFSAKCAIGDTFDGSIVADNGEWQSGTFTYSAANQVTTLTVQDSSNAGAAVTFGAGNKEIFIGMTASTAALMRERLAADRTYYVATTGNDSNDGLTVGTPFLTIQKAVDVISDTLDLNQRNVTVQLANGTYTSGVTARSLVGGTTITLQGNSGTPTSVVVSTTSASAIVSTIPGVVLAVRDMRLQTTTSGNCVGVGSGGMATVSGVDFAACASMHMAAQGGRITIAGNYTISGGAQVHYLANGYGYLTAYSRTVTITGTPAFSISFVLVNTPGGVESGSMTFSGAVTGVRYSVSNNGVIFTGGGGANYFPGNSAGTTSAGGQYV